MRELITVLVYFNTFALYVLGDTPANCTYGEIRGKWVFHIGKRGQDKSVNCSKFSMGDAEEHYKVDLIYPDLAVDEYGNYGFWTLIYNQGFEVILHGRKFFAFSKYTGSMENSTSYCDATLGGWSHDVLGHDWACYTGEKQQSLPSKTLNRFTSSKFDQIVYSPNIEFIEAINSVQTDWKAVHYPEYKGMTIAQLNRRSGGHRSLVSGVPRPAPVKAETKKLVEMLPSSFDWRNVAGTDFVPAVRNQGSCGSCYAFASMAMNEARVRVMTNNTKRPSFSPQDIVECSEYSQGCSGGFPYLIGGKYAEDFGIVEESCNPYKGVDGSCSTKKDCPRHYSTRYEYVGGFYGGCNAEEMRLALVKYGPMAVAFEVYDDFMNYKGGVYHHTGLKDHFNPFEITNHAVLLVGYGRDEHSGQDYWIVKNSWGTTWGEDGYFRIRRGVDECSIESIAVQSFPIF